jgi:hypothetical protein
MIDLHQGINGQELRELPPGLGTVGFAQLDVVRALLKGRVLSAIRLQAGTWLLLGRVVMAQARSALTR